MENIPTQSNTDTEKLEKELAGLEKESREKKGSDVELIQIEMEKIRKEIEQKKESSKEQGEKGTERVEKSGGEPEDVEDVKNAGDVLNAKTEEAAGEVEMSGTDLFEQAQAMEAEQKAAKPVEDELRPTIDIVMDKYKAEKPSEETAQTATVPGVEAEKPKEGAVVEQQEEIKKEFESLPQEEQKKVALGLQNIGFYVEENKNRFFASVFQNVRAAGVVNGWIKEEGSVSRWLNALTKSAEQDAELNKKKFEGAERTSMTEVASVGTTIGNITKYGRTLFDVVGLTAGAPLRYVMMGGMLFGTGAGASKEARFKNKEVLEKTRVQDINTAAEEAWKVYEQAKAGKETISKEDLNKAYQANVPKDLLARLQKDPEPGTASGILQGFIKYDVETSVKKINGKLEEVEQDKNLSDVEKKIKQEKILNKYSKHLSDLDRAVSQFGTVDALALGAKYAETGAKAIVTAMTVETLGLSIYKLWENLPGILETAHEYWDEKITVGAAPGIGGIATEAKPSLGVHNIVEIEKPAGTPVSEKLGELSESAIVQKGEGIEHAFIRQLSDDPEKFGFKGNINDPVAVKGWAGIEAHRVAIKAGYVDLETGNEVRVGGKGGNVAYELEKDPSGNIKVNEYLEDDKGNFSGEETKDIAKDFKSAQFETQEKSYEYEYARPEEPANIPEAPKLSTQESAKIDEYYDQRIAEQERLSGIKGTEMKDKSEYYDQRYDTQDKLNEIKRAGMNEKSEYFDQRIAEQERLKDIARAAKTETIENAQPKIPAESLHTEESPIKVEAHPEQAPKVDLSAEVKAPIVEHTPEVKVENIVTKTEGGGGNIVETTGVTAEIKGSTGQEFLSKDYMLKIKPSAAGMQFARTEAMMTSRGITARLGAYHELLNAGKTEEAAKHLDALRKSLDMADKSLGAGVIDRSKIPELK